MSPNGRMNLMLFLAVVVIAAGNVGAFTYSLWGPSFSLYWNDFLDAHLYRPAVKAGDRTIANCLKVSDFYSARLTTYFLGDSDKSAGGPTTDLSKYDEYCDRVPGTGKVIFSVTLMEKDVRSQSVALAFYKSDAKGGLELLTSVPSKPHPAGFVTLESSVDHKGKYLLELAFGEGKSEEDRIAMPISVGQ
ncbi:hypothetical protein A1351_11280 [Methylosinus sp. R-45379]|uniref:hypothetical protein n=1 Tax=unclassified Methylosinus TaxID=2624500 RepID=UPI0004794E45|nr:MULTISPECIES: hypothetical protein [unclassified Methylosinus]OAI28680.1 hypothetical protein A1351_11280 [Methylosinus sp. R-45379]TDX63924.1 hypothetical protein EDE12_10668 [Methylosinus sp. sav-2]